METRLQENDINSIRNIGIIAHIDAGKTTISEHFLFYSGKNHKIGEVDEGNTVLDYLDEERKRGITIVSAAASFKWKLNDSEFIFHLIDTPGHIDFTAEVERSLRVIDGAIVVFSAVEGVQAQSEKVWRQSDNHKVSKIAFINKLDRTGASFSRTLCEIRSKFSSVSVLPIQIPIGEENSLCGIIDLIKMKAIYFEGEFCEKVIEKDIPANFAESAKKMREELLDGLSLLSDRVLSEMLENANVKENILSEEIRRLVIERKLVPVLCGAAKKKIGIQPLLDAIAKYLPSPTDVGAIEAKNISGKEEILVHPQDKFFCGLVFKVTAGDSADLLYLRTYSGNLKLNEAVLNSRTGEKVRIKRLLRLYASNIEALEEVGPGDIIGIIGPTNTFTGDTLCSVGRRICLESIHFPEPVISLAIEPKSSKDKDRLDACLAMLSREDPTFSYKKNEATGQTILSGMGELHLEIKTKRIVEDFKIQAKVGLPQVAFRESLNSSCEVEGAFEKMMGEQLFSAKIKIFFEPLSPQHPTGIEIIFAPELEKLVPPEWLKVAQEAIINGLKTGGNYAYPLIYVKGTILSISSPDPKTAQAAIAAASLDAVRKALNFGTSILEPIVRVEIISPDIYLGEISGYLQSKKAEISHIGTISAEMKQLICEVPLSEMFGFSKALPKISSGRAAFSMEPCGYKEVSSRGN